MNAVSTLDMVRAAKEIGPILAGSRFFGVDNEVQGIALAFTSFQAGIPLEEYRRTYHVIEGKLTMRADAMLAGLVKLGGNYKVLRRDEAGASIEVTARGETKTFTLLWEDAQKEPFTKDKQGRVKSNYATPLKRTQMLWARVVSDAVRTMDSRVNHGVYTPEEFDGSSDVQDADFTVAKPVAAIEQQPQQPASQKAEAVIYSVPGGETMVRQEPAEEKPAEAKQPPARVPVDEATVAAIRTQIGVLQQNGLPQCGVTIVNRLAQFGMKKLVDLSLADAKELLASLQSDIPLTGWLNRELEPPGN